MSEKIKAYGLLILTTIFWGASFVSIKISMEVFGPLYLAFFRYLITAALIFVALKLTKKIKVIEKKDIKRVMLSGLFGITLYFGFENNAVLRISSNEAAILISTIPIFSLIFNRIIYKYKITFRNFISIAASIIGIYLIIGGGDFKLNAFGYMLMVMAAISWSAYQFVTKPLFEKYDDITITMYQSAFGAIGFIPFLPFEYLRIELMTTEILGHFMFLTIFCSLLGTYFYLYAQKNLGINITSVFLNLIPVSTFFFSYFILGENMSFIQILGSAIVIIAVSCVKEESHGYIKEELELEDIENIEAGG